MATINDNFNTTLKELGLGPVPEVKRDKNQLGQTEFLELMITQLKTQDPFSPMENGEFIAQMAQFSSVTGLAELQQSFEKLATSLQSNQALQASSLVGRSVMVPTHVGSIKSDGGLSGAVDLPASTNSVQVTIQDGVGQIVRRIELGSQAAGEIYFNWDGFDSGGIRAPSGKYYINATADIDGDPTALNTYVTSSVESVTLEQGGRMLTLNLEDGNTVDFSSVREIR